MLRIRSGGGRVRRLMAGGAGAALVGAMLGSPARAAISSSGNVSPSPPQTAGADPIIGVNDLGRFTITPSSVVLSDQVVIGQQFTGIGYAVVSGFDTGTGSGAVWNANNMVVGSSGTGVLEVLAGGVVTVDFAGNPGSGDLTIGLNPDSVGTVLVSGRGSLLRIGDETNIGHNPGGAGGGSGTLRIENEGLVIATNDAATNTDSIIVGVHGRIELSNGRLRGEAMNNSGVVTGNGRIDNEATIINTFQGRFEVGPGQRMVVNSGIAGGVGFDNDGAVLVAGGEIEFFEQFINSNSGADVTLRDGGRVHFPKTGFGFDSTSGVLASTAGTNDIYGIVRIQGPSSRIVVAGGSTAVFHEQVTNSGGTIEVFPGSTAVYLQGLLGGGGLSVHIAKPLDAPVFGQVQVGGGATVGGLLAITLAGGYRPAEGEAFPIISADALSGQFSSISGFDLGQGLYLRPVYATSGLTLVTTQAGAGDADLNGVVNGDDYVLTDRGFLRGLNGWGNGDFNHDGRVNISDLFLIDRGFATQANGPAGPGAGAASVPEPSAIVPMFSIAMLALGWRVRRGLRSV